MSCRTAYAMVSCKVFLSLKNTNHIIFGTKYLMSLQCGVLISFGTKYSVIARSCPLWSPQNILCTFGEKAHTNKRVSVIACDNAISKAQCAPYGREPYYKTHARYFCTCVEKKAQCAPYGIVSAIYFPLSHQLLLFFIQLSI